MTVKERTAATLSSPNLSSCTISTPLIYVVRISQLGRHMAAGGIMVSANRLGMAGGW